MRIFRPESISIPFLLPGFITSSPRESFFFCRQQYICHVYLFLGFEAEIRSFVKMPLQQPARRRRRLDLNEADWRQAEEWGGKGTIGAQKVPLRMANSIPRSLSSMKCANYASSDSPHRHSFMPEAMVLGIILRKVITRRRQP